jgi:hypothetical protein
MNHTSLKTGHIAAASLVFGLASARAHRPPAPFRAAARVFQLKCRCLCTRQ